MDQIQGTTHEAFIDQGPGQVANPTCKLNRIKELHMIIAQVIIHVIHTRIIASNHMTTFCATKVLHVGNGPVHQTAQNTIQSQVIQLWKGHLEQW